MSSRDGWNSRNLGRLFDGGADTLIGAAAANVTGHRRIDIGIARVRIVGEQRGRRHDLARLAIAALNDFEVEPGLLDLSANRGFADQLDGGQVLADCIGSRCDAGADCLTIEMHGAGAAQRDSAAEFGSGQPYNVAENPQQRHIVRNLELVFLAVNPQRHHGC